MKFKITKINFGSLHGISFNLRFVLLELADILLYDAQ